MKFKPGQKIVCVEGHPPHFAIGRVLTVRAHDYDEDDDLVFFEEVPNGWFSERFVSLEDAVKEEA